MMKRRRPTPPYLVQVVADLEWDYFREVALGARHYGFETGRLRFADHWLEHELAEGIEKLVMKRGIHGLIIPLHSAADFKRVSHVPVPIVNVSNSLGSPNVPLVTQDDEEVGRLAAEHLLANGCRVFGFWGMGTQPYSESRLRGFKAGLAEKGFTLSVGRALGTSRQWVGKLRAWLGELPLPAGIFAADDSRALTVMRIALEFGYRVPEDIAVLGAGNESYWVDFERTPLTSIPLPARAIGYQAAALLDELITTGRREAPTRRLPVSGLVRRKSTDILFIEDEALRRALAFIRQHAHENPYVEDVARAAGVSRAVLKARFRKQLGRSVLEEILRVRIDLAQRLLAETTLPTSAVAERCGFPNSQRFSLRFKQSTGLTPTAYRKRSQAYAG